MAVMIRTETYGEAWLAAAEHLFSSPCMEEVHLFLDIERPSIRNTSDVEVFTMVEEFAQANNKKAKPIATVAGTIFPVDYYSPGDNFQRLFDAYPRDMDELTEGRPDERNGRWGVYALRMVRQESRDGRPLNQIKRVVSRLKNGSNRACYEISPGSLYALWDEPDNVADVATYDPAADGRRVRGGPCLSHLSFTRDHEGTLHLNATYRSHYYLGRAAGNLLGLSQFLTAMAIETGCQVGSLGINATFAKLEANDFGGKRKVDTLLKRCRAAYDLHDTPDRIA